MISEKPCSILSAAFTTTHNTRKHPRKTEEIIFLIVEELERGYTDYIHNESKSQG